MKFSICDVCYYEKDKKKLTPCTWNIRRKQGSTAVKLQVCDDHKGYFDDCKNIKEAQDKADRLILGLNE